MQKYTWKMASNSLKNPEILWLRKSGNPALSVVKFPVLWYFGQFWSNLLFSIYLKFNDQFETSNGHFMVLFTPWKIVFKQPVLSQLLSHFNKELQSTETKHITKGREW